MAHIAIKNKDLYPLLDILIPSRHRKYSMPFFVLDSIVRPSILGVIPARYASTRFPGKPLARLAGKPMLQHVWERCRASHYLSRIIIATDSELIRDAAHDFGAEAVMTRADHPSGTDRVD
jgi:3-deoxy-manno-octulosonate cytidylyltransferase (CMP-KDO synthetase)